MENREPYCDVDEWNAIDLKLSFNFASESSRWSVYGRRRLRSQVSEGCEEGVSSPYPNSFPSGWGVKAVAGMKSDSERKWKQEEEENERKKMLGCCQAVMMA